jgi:outer membrane PBP1 activator LpoA protein
MLCGGFAMKLALGFGLCVLCGWLTADAQVIPASNGSSRAVPFQTVSSGWLASSQEPNNNKVPNRDEIVKQIDTTAIALNALNGPLAGEDQKIAALIRTCIIRARQALKSDDLDGAGTLSRKARALQLELSKDCLQRSGQKAKIRPI